MIVCDRDHLGLGSYSCRRNAFGRQLHSFEADLGVSGIGEEPMRAVFIRAPWVEDPGGEAEVLAEQDGHPVALREGNLLACAFHPELTEDPRFHALFLAMVSSAARAAAGGPR
jgi:5'-phosphate synthase pdxT subunit